MEDTNPREPSDVSARLEEDARWVVAACEGDPQAFDRLVNRYQRRAVSVAYRFLGNVEDASDVAQDALIRAYRNLAKLDEPEKFAAWLMRIVTNLALNFRKARARRSAVSTDGIDGAGDMLPTPEGTSSPESHVIEGDVKRVVREAINALPDKQRTALTLFSLEGLPQKEVAEIMECSLELVKWNVFQARKNLREALSDFVES